MMAHQSENLTVRQAAERLNVAPSDIYTYIHNGELPAWNKTADPHTTRPRYRIEAAAVDAFREARRVAPAVKRVRVRRWGRRLDVL